MLQDISGTTENDLVLKPFLVSYLVSEMSIVSEPK